MAFGSVHFLFLFLPFSLLAWLGCGTRARLPLLVALSLLFSLWGSGWLVLLLVASIALTHGIGLAIAPGRTTAAGATPARRGALLALGIAGNLLPLAYWKYAGFAAQTLSVLGLGGIDAPAARAATQAVLPLGISFSTFKAIGYLVDVFRGTAPAARGPLQLTAYLALFPQLTAGPIGRWTELGPQLGALRRPGATLFAEGAFRFVAGLAKKVLIADVIGAVADDIFRLDPARIGVAGAWVGAVAYALQIYFDFSGYSDMAIGVGRMLGLRFAENFEYPYLARSVREFWRRWHISLSTWFRDYLYVPLGGGRASPPRVAANLLVVFALCGLWHGANWTFVVWGLYHGLFLAAERLGLGAALERAPRAAQHLYALLVVTAGWVLFRAESLEAGLQFLRSMVVPGDDAPLVVLAKYDTPLVKAALACALGGAGPWVRDALARLRLRLAAPPAGGVRPALVAYQTLACAALVALLALAVLRVAAGSSTPFLYARF
jgi:alginate O-acetyltransferase complex protein AlgI